MQNWFATLKQFEELGFWLRQSLGIEISQADPMFLIWNCLQCLHPESFHVSPNSFIQFVWG